MRARAFLALLALVLASGIAAAERDDDDAPPPVADEDRPIQWEARGYLVKRGPGEYSSVAISRYFWACMEHKHHTPSYDWNMMRRVEQLAILKGNEPGCKKSGEDFEFARNDLKSALSSADCKDDNSMRLLEAAKKRTEKTRNPVAFSLGNDFGRELDDLIKSSRVTLSAAEGVRSKTLMAQRRETGSSKIVSSLAAKKIALSTAYDGGLQSREAAAQHPSRVTAPSSGAAGTLRDAGERAQSRMLGKDEKAPPPLKEPEEPTFAKKAGAVAVAAGVVAVGILTAGFLIPSSTDPDVGERRPNRPSPDRPVGPK